MTRRVAFLMLLAALVAVVASQDSTATKPKNSDGWKDAINGMQSVRGPPSTSIEDNKKGDKTTMGVAIQLARLISPFTEICLLLLDSWLRNTRNKALPCTVYSFVPLRGVCTPL